ncbi:hypothetical protein K402DRAFT_95216 [Aulographum hederae CBS 113979]|uniref:Uncharacterized protein n=1 Tax=Aulographum hederae CBS 113979 TaxID=1176131 RepID=A0A6G1GYN1_9PEZI|nr:hypothetical protein K402DRAFT_95216 [Aulographum hederae CBS 113979]
MAGQPADGTRPHELRLYLRGREDDQDERKTKRECAPVLRRMESTVGGGGRRGTSSRFDSRLGRQSTLLLCHHAVYIYKHRLQPPSLRHFYHAAHLPRAAPCIRASGLRLGNRRRNQDTHVGSIRTPRIILTRTTWKAGEVTSSKPNKRQYFLVSRGKQPYGGQGRRRGEPESTGECVATNIPIFSIAMIIAIRCHTKLHIPSPLYTYRRV